MSHFGRMSSTAAGAIGSLYPGRSYGTLDEEWARLQDEVEDECEQEHAGVEPGGGGFGGRYYGLFPLADVLGPIQVLLGKHLIYVRAVRRVLTWHDRILTLQISALLLLLSLLLALAFYAVAKVPTPPRSEYEDPPVVIPPSPPLSAPRAPPPDLAAS